MADSRRQQIIDAINTQLKTIKPTTYETAIGLNVFWDRDTDKNPIQESESPCLIVETSDEEMEQHATKAELHGLVLKIKGLSLPGTNIKDKMRSDIIKCLDNSGDETWSTLADDSRTAGNGEYDETHNERKFQGVELEFTINYQTANGDPYKLPS